MRSLVGAILNKAPVPHAPKTKPRPGFGFAHAGAPSSPLEQMQAIFGSGTLHSIISRLSESVAMVEWDLWRAAPSGLKEDRDRIEKHAALDLWQRPNPWMARLEFTAASQQYADLTGEAWWLVGRNPRARKLPLELWPARPDRMLPIPDRRNFLSGYIYQAPDGEEVPLRTDEVVRVRLPNPLDPYRGLSAVGTILTDLEAARSAAEWNRNFFRNAAEPGGIIQVDRRLDDDEFDDLSARWAEQHRGVSAAHRVAVLEQGMTWVDRSISQRDMQFTELREVGRDVVREAFGVPKFVLGDVDDVNRASARESSVFFNQYLVVPRLERIKSVLNSVLLPSYGDTTTELEFDYRSPVPPDRESDNEELTAKTEGVKALVEAGFEPAAACAAVGLPEMAYIGPPQPARATTDASDSPRKSASSKN